ncbi:hypothetical protein FRB93_002153 [Tulasnella sp. JGI-2019a]|nr:hypothetical protein FRB93_002153 [Tulasnella sp. JGI-2019a]
MGVAHSSRAQRQQLGDLYWPELPESSKPAPPSPSSSYSARSFSLYSRKQKCLAKLFKGNFGSQDGSGRDIDTSQAARLIDDILELILRMLLEGSRGLAEDASRLAVMSKVNRHWNRIADRMLYRTVELKDYMQLHHFIKTLNQNRAKCALVCHLRIPDMISYDPGLLPSRMISADARLQDQSRAQVQTNEMVMHLLTLPTQLASLDIHGGAVRLWVEGADVAVQSKPLPNLSTLSSLCLRGRHDGRWRFLLRYTSGLTRFRASPDWTTSDNPSLPFDSYNLRSLTLVDSRSLTVDHFLQLLQTSRPQLSRAIFRSHIRNLELVNVPTILSSPQLPHFIGLLSPTLQSLRISSTSSEETEYITKVLTDTLPALSSLTHLNTSAHTVPVFSPSLHSLTITLGSIGTPPSMNSSETVRSAQNPPVGMIYHTIINLLNDVVPGTSLKQLTIIDAAVQDYLFFNLAGSRDYGNDVESERQNRLWMKAAKEGVLITVVNPTKDIDPFGFEEMQAWRTGRW